MLSLTRALRLVPFALHPDSASQKNHSPSCSPPPIDNAKLLLAQDYTLSNDREPRLVCCSSSSYPVPYRLRRRAASKGSKEALPTLNPWHGAIYSCMGRRVYPVVESLSSYQQYLAHCVIDKDCAPLSWQLVLKHPASSERDWSIRTDDLIMPTKLSANDYHIGVICALSKERTAVEGMLDGERHERLPQIHGDYNVYTFGTIAKHNVVIASLAHGTYGTVSAAGVANDLRRSFPNVKYGLMVGIAGAIPRPDSKDGDVRLGDIVVGCAEPSIVHYARGKQGFEGLDIRSELTNPPEMLQRAVGALQSSHSEHGPTYLLHAGDTLQRRPRLNLPDLPNDYYNLPDSTDQLFRSNIVHDDENDDCAVCLTMHDSVVPRKRRPQQAPPPLLITQKFVKYQNGKAEYPKLFIGSIGSADTLMKTAGRRDSVYKEVLRQCKAKLLCFEMEASGVVKNWPCLVIRGICDYSDSHKNDDWQNFAALMAAAYAKDLLTMIEPTDVITTASNEVPGSSSAAGGRSSTRFDNKQATTRGSHGSSSTASRPGPELPMRPPRRLPPRSIAETEEQNRQLLTAASDGDGPRVQELHRAGADVNFTDPAADAQYRPSTPMAAAIEGYSLWHGMTGGAYYGSEIAQNFRLRRDAYSHIVKYLYEQGADFDALSEPRKVIARKILQ